MQDAPSSPVPPPVAIVSAPAAVAPILLAPPAPMAPPPGNFDDFLASLPVGVDHEGVDGGMGGGQPLEEADLFGFDLFGYDGT